MFMYFLKAKYVLTNSPFLRNLTIRVAMVIKWITISSYSPLFKLSTMLYTTIAKSK